MKGKKKGLFFGVMLFVMMFGALPAMATQYSVMDNYMIDARDKTIYTPIIKVSGYQWYDMVYYRGKLKKNSLKYDKTLLDITDSGFALSILPKKAGLTDVVFKTKEDGKTQKFTLRVKTFKLKGSPIKSLKFGKREVINSKNFSSINQYSVGTPNIFSKGKDTSKMVIKTRSGWSIKSAVSITNVNGKEKQKKLNLKKKITIKSNSHIMITLVDKKGNEVFYNIYGMVNN